ncbi:MAG: hypothetical protein AAF682_02145 [Planctomycetota bacterium]
MRFAAGILCVISIGLGVSEGVASLDAHAPEPELVEIEGTSIRYHLIGVPPKEAPRSGVGVAVVFAGSLRPDEPEALLPAARNLYEHVLGPDYLVVQVVPTEVGLGGPKWPQEAEESGRRSLTDRILKDLHGRKYKLDKERFFAFAWRLDDDPAPYRALLQEKARYPVRGLFVTGSRLPEADLLADLDESDVLGERAVYLDHRPFRRTESPDSRSSTHAFALDAEEAKRRALRAQEILAPLGTVTRLSGADDAYEWYNALPVDDLTTAVRWLEAVSGAGARKKVKSKDVSGFEALLQVENLVRLRGDGEVAARGVVWTTETPSGQLGAVGLPDDLEDAKRAECLETVGTVAVSGRVGVEPEWTWVETRVTLRLPGTGGKREARGGVSLRMLRDGFLVDEPVPIIELTRSQEEWREVRALVPLRPEADSFELTFAGGHGRLQVQEASVKPLRWDSVWPDPGPISATRRAR